MQKSLLTHIASNFISEYENVANSSVSYLLNEYLSAREALKNILGLSEVPKYYRTELATKNNGRPDITGFNTNGDKSIIIEGKFWANLTKNQPENYLCELKLSGNGKLLFLAPEKRLILLEAEIKNRVGENDKDKVIIYSWLNFLKVIELENNKEHNHYLNSDLIQLKELCQKMDSEGMPPLSASDLDPMNGRISYQLAQLLDDCHFLLKKWDVTNFNKFKKTNSKYGFGFYFEAFNFTCNLYFSNHKWFARDLQTPFWLVINKNWKASSEINHLLKELNPENVYEDSIGIELLVGMDKEQAVKHLVKETKEVLEYLNEKTT